MIQRKFPSPWRVDTTHAGHFVVRDANGFSLTYVYCRTDSALRDKYLTPAQALQIAQLISTLPDLYKAAKE
jgi:hypothetical protein